MPVKFSPSVNIIRDSGRRINYIPTPNAANAIQKIIGDFKNTGERSNIIIGSYGSGKSSLLWAFEQTLKGEAKYFDVSSLECKPAQTKILKFIGESDSIINSFGEQLHIKKLSAGNQEIFDSLFQEYKSTKNGVLVLIIDEFGKYLEYAAKHHSEKELFFIQQLAEFCNNSDWNILLVTTLHQNFDAYSFGLSEQQRNEWKKVKGRLKEITFNEPIEQLLLLAASFNNGNPDTSKQKQFIEINKLVYTHHLFRINKEFANSLGCKLFPLDFISGYCMTLALQRYGQNERSLFTFLESTEFKQIKETKTEYLTIAWLYDYLWANFYSFLNSTYNSDFNAWTDIKEAIERAEVVIEKDVEETVSLLKTIGLLNIFSSKGARINNEFLLTYLENTANTRNAENIFKQLVQHKIILYANYNDSYKLFEGTDKNIDQEFINAEKKVDEITNVPAYINKHFGQLPVITAKEISYQRGTPRHFAFVVSETPKKLKAEDELDGYINLIINESIDDKVIPNHSKKDEEANIYGYFQNSKKIKSILIDIEKALKVKSENEDDKVVLKEMDNIINSNKNLLRHYFIDAIYTDDVLWYYKGEPKTIRNKKQFNKLLSKAAKEVYLHTPVFKNELVNRNKISSSIHTARKDFFSRLVNNWTEKDFGYDDNFPPDKTIYISLLLKNEIHKKIKGEYTFSAPEKNSSFFHVWKACDEFLASTKNERRPISELYEMLLKKPYKLKMGLAEFWIPIFLFVKRDDYALFGNNGYIPDVNETTLLLFARNADEYTIKAFNFEGVKLDLFNKYRELLNQATENKPTRDSFVESIKPFLVFYRQLYDYSKQTKRLSKEALAVREAITASIDPEKTFFEDFPRALNVSIKELTESKESLQQYSETLKESINEIRTSYDELINRFEAFICKEIVGGKMPFKKYKEQLQARFENVKEHMMLNYQKVFHQRISSHLDERKYWLSSLAQALINKSLETIKDEDEKVLYEKLKTVVHELDNLVEISNVKIDASKEKVFKFEVTGENMVHKTIVKIPKTKFAELEETEKQINKILKKDKQLNIAVLTKLMQQQLNNEKG